jgi:non-ribosomal peptide synthetase component E (peptide arylation enzyme)
VAKDIFNTSRLAEEHEVVLQRVVSGQTGVNKRFIHRMFDEYGFDDDMATVVLTIGTVTWLLAVIATVYQFQPTFDQDFAIVLVATYIQAIIVSYLFAKIFSDKARRKRIADTFRKIW